MPPRTNIFQEVVAIIHRHMADGAKVVESAELVHALTQRRREVDVAITARVAGREVVVSIEATKAGRRAGQPWVEQQIKKHEHLPTSELVLVSEAGFTKPGREMAEKSPNVAAIEPEDLSEGDPVGAVVNNLRSIWPKTLSLAPERVQVWTQRDGELYGPIRAEVDMEVVLDDGQELGNLGELVSAWVKAHMREVGESVGLADMTEDGDHGLIVIAEGVSLVIDGEPRAPCLRYVADDGGGDQYHPIARIRILGRAIIRVCQVELSHRRLGEVFYAEGEGRLGDRHALVVVTETEGGGTITIRQRDRADHER